MKRYVPILAILVIVLFASDGWAPPPSGGGGSGIPIRKVQDLLDVTKPLGAANGEGLLYGTDANKFFATDIQTAIEAAAHAGSASDHHVATVAGDLDHGGIGGLGDDDHDLYFQTDGSEAATGAFDMGAYGLTNTGPITGATTGSFASTLTATGALDANGTADFATTTVFNGDVQVGTTTADEYNTSVDVEGNVIVSKVTTHARATTPTAYVSFIIDDLPDTALDMYTNVFQPQGEVANVAVITSLVATGNYLTYAELTTLEGYGWEILSHTISHPNLTAETSTDLVTELADSKTILEAQGFTVNNLAYPGGNHNAAVRLAAKKYYRSGRALGNGINERTPDTFSIKSLDIDDHTGLTTYQAAVDTAEANYRWLTFYFHSTTSDDETAMNTLIDYIQAKGIEIVTVNQALDLLENVIEVGDTGGSTTLKVSPWGELDAPIVGPVVVESDNTVVATKNKKKNIISDSGEVIFSRQSAYWTTTWVADTESYGLGFEALLNNKSLRSNGFGYQALFNNTGKVSSGFGYQSLYGNVGDYASGFGYQSLMNNTQDDANGFGYQSLMNNGGDRSNGLGYQALTNNEAGQSNGFGYQALRDNTGAFSNGMGNNAGHKNTGLYMNAFGYYGMANNTGGHSMSFGFAAGQNNNWDYVTIIGEQALDYFDTDTATLETFTHAAVNDSTNNINVPTHGFGSSGKVNLMFETVAGTPPTGLTDGNVYQVTITDASNLNYPVTSNGAGTFTFTNSVDITNSTAIGYNANATKSNQVILGNANVTETVLRGNVLIDVHVYDPQSSEATTTEGTVAYDDGADWSGNGEGWQGYRDGAWVALAPLPSFASIYADNVTVVINTTNTDTLATSGWTLSETDSIAYNSTTGIFTIGVDGAGVYDVDFSVSVSGQSNASVHYHLHAAGAGVPAVESHRKLSGNDVGNSAMSNLVRFAVGDTIKVMTQQDTGTTNQLLEHGSFNIFRVSPQ